MTGERKSLSSFWHPRYWPVWIAMGLLRLICLLPHRVALAIGRAFGRIAHGVGPSRRAIVRRNLELCFPELSSRERNTLVLEHFKALGMTFIEMGLGRWASRPAPAVDYPACRHRARASCAAIRPWRNSAQRAFHDARDHGPRAGAAHATVRRRFQAQPQRLHDGAAAHRP